MVDLDEGGGQRENAGRVSTVGMDGGYGWEAGGKC